MPALRRQLRLRWPASFPPTGCVPAPTTTPLCCGPDVYQRDDGRPLTLGPLLGAGGEASVYALAGDPRLAAKIYTRLEPARAAKLRQMIARRPSGPNLAWPEALIRDQVGNVAGFLMPRIDLGKAKPLLMLINPADRRENVPGWTWSSPPLTARNLAAAVEAVHAAGYVIGDLNESNILVDSATRVTLVDCDLMQVRAPDGTVFRCRVGKAEFTPPELQGAPFASVDRTTAHDGFALSVVVFSLLMEGVHPFLAVRAGAPLTIEQLIRSGSFPYGDACRRRSRCPGIRCRRVCRLCWPAALSRASATRGAAGRSRVAAGACRRRQADPGVAAVRLRRTATSLASTGRPVPGASGSPAASPTRTRPRPPSRADGCFPLSLDFRNAPLPYHRRPSLPPRRAAASGLPCPASSPIAQRCPGTSRCDRSGKFARTAARRGLSFAVHRLVSGVPGVRRAFVLVTLWCAVWFGLGTWLVETTHGLAGLLPAAGAPLYFFGGWAAPGLAVAWRAAGEPRSGGRRFVGGAASAAVCLAGLMAGGAGGAAGYHAAATVAGSSLVAGLRPPDLSAFSLSRPPSGTVVFSERFDGKSGGWAVASGQGTLTSRDGELGIRNTSPTALLVVSPRVFRDPLGDVLVEAEITRTDGSSSAGIALRLDAPDGYHLLVNEAGRLYVGRYVEKSPARPHALDRMVERQGLPDLPPRGPLRLALAAQGRRISAYVNDRQSAAETETRAEARTTGSIGIVVEPGASVTVHRVQGLAAFVSALTSKDTFAALPQAGMPFHLTSVDGMR